MSPLAVWLYTIGIVLVWTVVLATASAADIAYPATAQAIRRKATALESTLKFTPPIAEWAQKQERNCKSLCQQCGCIGFYCGEECICECNNENSDTECIATMQQTAKQLSIPFELLIQGPSSNRFVRNAMQFGREMQPIVTEPARNKRSTVVIYKPESPTAAADTEIQASERFKRSSNSGSSQLDWFNDLTAALVRPAPINNKRAKSNAEDDISSFLHKRSPKADMDRSWFVDNNSQSLFRPAPLSKRQNSKRRDYEASNEFPDAIAVVEQLPRVIKNTLRNLQESSNAANSNTADEQTDFWTGLARNEPRNKQTRGDSASNSNTLSEVQRWRDNLVDAFERFMEQSKQQQRTSTTTTTSTTTSPAAATRQEEGNGQLLIPRWFRPMRFLQRVSHALTEQQ